MILIYTYMFILGAIIGSFLNVVGIRVPIKRSIVSPPSTCGNCQQKIKKYDLIPIFSYFILGGKCRNCKQKLSPVYPIFEFVTGVLFVVATIYATDWKELLFSCLLISIMIALTVADFEYKLVPDSVLLFAIVALVPMGIYLNGEQFYNHIWAGVGAFVFFLFLGIVSKGGMGGGDIKLIGVLGLALGFQEIVIIILVASISGLILGLLVRIITKKKETIPFVPYITIGVLAAHFYGEYLWEFLIR